MGYFYKSHVFTQELPSQVSNESGYMIGTPVQKEGILKADGDLLTYTHTLTTSDGEKFLLKSTTLPLNNYSSSLSGVFQIWGSIESMYEGLPLVEVSTIGTQTTSEQNQLSGEVVPVENLNPGVYVAKAGLGFPAAFFDQYAFVGDAEKQGTISLKNLDNEKVTTISYFSCTTHGDNNCKELTRTFSNTAVKTITTLNGDSFYKLPEVKSWYFQNNTWRGYFINDADDEEVEKIKNLITLANPELIKQIVQQHGAKTCLGNTAGTAMISTHQVEKTAEGLKVIMEGKGEKQFSCEAWIDLSQPHKMKFIDIKTQDLPAMTSPALDNKNEEKKEETKTDTPQLVETSTEGGLTPSAKQFPINLEKTMTYNSSRGEYAMTFPSSNISYSSDTADEDFGQVGVRCPYATKVIQYKDREDLQSAPAVIVYECSFKQDFQLPGNDHFLKELGDKKFVIKVNHADWFDFAKNITITSF